MTEAAFFWTVDLNKKQKAKKCKNVLHIKKQKPNKTLNQNQKTLSQKSLSFLLSKLHFTVPSGF